MYSCLYSENEFTIRNVNVWKDYCKQTKKKRQIEDKRTVDFEFNSAIYEQNYCEQVSELC